MVFSVGVKCRRLYFSKTLSLATRYLLARQAGEAEEYAASARVFCKLAEAKIAEAYTYVMNSTTEDVALFKAVENEV